MACALKRKIVSKFFFPNRAFFIIINYIATTFKQVIAILLTLKEIYISITYY
jgi:hypothetical protein